MTLMNSHPESDDCWVFNSNTSAGHLTSLVEMNEIISRIRVFLGGGKKEGGLLNQTY